jgi:hypothetical protein
MKITVNEENAMQLEEVFNSVVLKTSDGEKMAICMRDSGFEFKYQGKWYFAKEGYVKPFYCWDEQSLGKDRRCQEECDTCASVQKEK